MYDKAQGMCVDVADHLLETFSSSTVPALPHSMPQRSHQIMRLPRPKKEVQREISTVLRSYTVELSAGRLTKIGKLELSEFFFFFEHDLVCFQHLTMIIPLRPHSSPRKCERTIVRCI